MYTIILKNGLELKNVDVNGNNYIIQNLDKTIFNNDDLKEIKIINDENNSQTLYNQKVQFAKIGNIDTFIFIEKSKEEILQERINELELFILMQEGVI